MSRLYVVETDLTATGMFADHRLRAKPSELVPLLAALARALGRLGASDLARLPVPPAIAPPIGTKPIGYARLDPIAPGARVASLGPVDRACRADPR